MSCQKFRAIIDHVDKDLRFDRRAALALAFAHAQNCNVGYCLLTTEIRIVRHFTKSGVVQDNQAGKEVFKKKKFMR